MEATAKATSSAVEATAKATSTPRNQLLRAARARLNTLGVPPKPVLLGVCPHDHPHPDADADADADPVADPDTNPDTDVDADADADPGPGAARRMRVCDALRARAHPPRGALGEALDRGDAGCARQPTPPAAPACSAKPQRRARLSRLASTPRRLWGSSCLGGMLDRQPWSMLWRLVSLCHIVWDTLGNDEGRGPSVVCVNTKHRPGSSIPWT